MPELPEVELHRRHLHRWLAGVVIHSVTLRPTRLLRGSTAAALRREVTRGVRGQRAVGVERRGKHLFVVLGSGSALYVHLGMTGHLARRNTQSPAPSHVVLTLGLGDHVVEMTDPRRFSCMALLGGGMDDPRSPARGLGPDLLDAPPSAGELRERLASRRGPIKPVLMDQAVVAGLGNIHAAEALWRARIPPHAPARSLDARACAALLRGVRATFRVVLDDDDGAGVPYVENGAPNPFKVYARAGEPCPRCGSAIVRTVQAGRSTFFCPACQS